MTIEVQVSHLASIGILNVLIVIMAVIQITKFANVTYFFKWIKMIQNYWKNPVTKIC